MSLAHFRLCFPLLDRQYLVLPCSSGLRQGFRKSPVASGAESPSKASMATPSKLKILCLHGYLQNGEVAN
jgi:hypothetical protein